MRHPLITNLYIIQKNRQKNHRKFTAATLNFLPYLVEFLQDMLFLKRRLLDHHDFGNA